MPTSAPSRRAVLVPATLLAAVLGYCVEGSATLHDGGELAAAAVELGASHPPGQPLHALIGYLATWLPVGDVIARLALLSASCALASAWLAAALTAELCDELSIEDGRIRAAAEVSAALAVALALPVLRQSLRVEVYSLALVMLLGTAWLLVRWARRARPGLLWAAAFLSGLSIGVHAPHGLAAVLLAGCLGLLAPRRLLGSTRTVLGALAFGVLGLGAFVYLPARAAAGAGMWGDPSTLAGFLQYASGRTFMNNLVSDDRLALVMAYVGHLVATDLGVPYVGALLLLWLAPPQARPVVVGAVLAALGAVLAAGLQPLEADNPDNVAYLCPAVALLAVTGATGFAALARRGHRVLAGCLLGVLALPPATVVQLPERLQADVPALETLSGVLAEAPPPRALVLVTSEHVSTTWLMLERVDRVRPDVAVMVRGLSTSSWHWARLRTRPGLGRPVRVGSGDAHDAFARGAALSAVAHVPVALEQDLSELRPNVLVGPYALLDPRRPLGRLEPSPRSMAERWLPMLSAEGLEEPPGDAGAATRVVEDLLVRRALRFQTTTGAAPGAR